MSRQQNDLQPTHATPGIQVAASQGSAAAPLDSMSRLGAALGVLQKPLANMQEAFDEEDRARYDLEGKLYGLEVAEGAQKNQKLWNDDEDGEAKLEQYHNQALAGITNPQMRSAAQVAILSSLHSSRSARIENREKQDALAIETGLLKVLTTQAENGSLSTLEGASDALSYINTMYPNDQMARRKGGEMLISTLRDQAISKGNPALLNDAVLSQLKIDDVSLATLYADSITKARADAEGTAVEQYVKAHSEERIKVKEGVAAGYHTSGSLRGLRKKQPNLFSQAEWESLHVGAVSAAKDQAEGTATAYLAGQKRLSEAPPKKQQEFLGNMVDTMKKDGKSMQEITKAVADQGVAYEPWATELNNFVLVQPDKWDGTVPKEVQVAYERFQALRPYPGLLDKTLKDKKAKDMLLAMEYAQLYDETDNASGMNQTAAYAKALHINSDVNYNSDAEAANYKVADAAVARITSTGTFSSAQNVGDIQSVLKNGILYHKRLGAGDDVAAAEAEKDYLAANRLSNGVYVFTGGRDLPENFDAVKTHAIETRIIPGLPEDMREDAQDDFYLRPDPQRNGVFQVWQKPFMATGVLVDAEEITTELAAKHAAENPVTPPADLANERNYQAWRRTRREQDAQSPAAKRMGQLEGVPDYEAMGKDIEKLIDTVSMGPAADPTVKPYSVVGPGVMLDHTLDALTNSYEGMVEAITGEKKSRKEYKSNQK